MKLIDPAAYPVVRAAMLAEKGSWPVAGGWTDQTQACVDAVELFWHEESLWRAKLGIRE